MSKFIENKKNKRKNKCHAETLPKGKAAQAVIGTSGKELD